MKRKGVEQRDVERRDVERKGVGALPELPARPRPPVRFVRPCSVRKSAVWRAGELPEISQEGAARSVAGFRA